MGVCSGVILLWGYQHKSSLDSRGLLQLCCFLLHWEIYRKSGPFCPGLNVFIILTHLGGVTHMCISKLTIIGSDNGVSPAQRQAFTWTIAGILLIGTLGTNFGEILWDIYTYSFKKMHLKMVSVKWRPFFLSLNVLIRHMQHLWWSWWRHIINI